MIDWGSINVSGVTEEAFTTLYRHWQEIRNGNAIPRKSDFNPGKVKSVLSEMAIMERMDSDTVTYRLAGTALTERAGFEQTGSNVLDSFPGHVGDIINNAYVKSAAHPCAGYHKVVMSFEQNLTSVIDCLYLPLADNNGNVPYHIVLFFIADKEGYRMARSQKFIRFKVTTICYPDIGHGTLECDKVPGHDARLGKD